MSSFYSHVSGKLYAKCDRYLNMLRRQKCELRQSLFEKAPKEYFPPLVVTFTFYSINTLPSLPPPPKRALAPNTVYADPNILKQNPTCQRSGSTILLVSQDCNRAGSGKKDGDPTGSTSLIPFPITLPASSSFANSLENSYSASNQ